MGSLQKNMNRYLALILILGVSLIQAQTPLGTVTGLATDPSGSAIGNATITLSNKGTGVKLTTNSNGSGAYSLPNLAPGTYSLTAEAPGFKKIEVADFNLLAFRTLRQDLKFEVAGVATDVTVEASSSTVIQ